MTTLINGTGNGATLSGLSETQQACVELLQEALNEALAGHVNSIGIVLCMQDGFASVMAGYQAADLNLGCDSLKRKLLSAIEVDGNRKQARSSILRAR